jgi:hypothetical protein
MIGLDGESPKRRILVAVVERKRQRGRLKLRWEDGVMDGARKLGEKHWRNFARNKDGWQKLLKKAWAETGLLCRIGPQIMFRLTNQANLLTPVVTGRKRLPLNPVSGSTDRR